MELKMVTPLDTALPKEIKFNHEELKAELAEKLEKYNNLVVTEDSIGDAKKDRALLNKLLKAVEDKRKDVKKQCLLPYEDFEKKIKQIISMIWEPITAIDTQVKAFNDMAKEEKTNRIAEFFQSEIGDLAGVVSLDRLWNPKWMNVSFKMVAIEKEIANAIFKISNDLKIITAMKSEYELQMKDTYLKSFDMSAALAERTRLEEQKAKLDEYNKRQAEKAEVKSFGENIKSINNGEVVIFSETPAALEASETTEKPKTIKVIFYDTTEAFRHEMKTLTTKHNIKYGGIR